jgi:hypothetical protein
MIDCPLRCFVCKPFEIVPEVLTSPFAKAQNKRFCRCPAFVQRISPTIDDDLFGEHPVSRHDADHIVVVANPLDCLSVLFVPVPLDSLVIPKLEQSATIVPQLFVLKTFCGREKRLGMRGICKSRQLPAEKPERDCDQNDVYNGRNSGDQYCGFLGHLFMPPSRNRRRNDSLILPDALNFSARVSSHADEFHCDYACEH